MKCNRHALVAALGLALLAAGCQSSKNTPAKPSPQTAGPVASSAPPNGPPPGPWQPAEGGEVWRSETTGNDYRVKIVGNKLYAEWANPSPVASKYHAYIHTECERKGSTWVGTSEIVEPCTEGSGLEEHIANTCQLKMKMEIDSISKTLIKGRAQNLHRFDCGSCKVIEAGWANFEWVPAIQGTENRKAQNAKPGK